MKSPVNWNRQAVHFSSGGNPFLPLKTVTKLTDIEHDMIRVCLIHRCVHELARARDSIHE